MGKMNDSAILQQNDASEDVNNDSEVLGQIVLEPGKTTSFVVGIFEGEIPQPQLSVDFEGEAEVDTSLERQQDGDEYWLTYHFRNLKSMRCLATVRTC